MVAANICYEYGWMLEGIKYMVKAGSLWMLGIVIKPIFVVTSWMLFLVEMESMDAFSMSVSTYVAKL